MQILTSQRTVLWALKGRRAILTCVLQTANGITELQLLCGGRVAARREFDDLGGAHRRAVSLRHGLILRGWWEIAH